MEDGRSDLSPDWLTDYLSISWQGREMEQNWAWKEQLKQKEMSEEVRDKVKNSEEDWYIKCLPEPSDEQEMGNETGKANFNI